MLISFILSRLSRRSRLARPFTWAPALDLSDPVVRSTLIPGTTP